jgi:hypothetical protein
MSASIAEAAGPDGIGPNVAVQSNPAACLNIPYLNMSWEA